MQKWPLLSRPIARPCHLRRVDDLNESAQGGLLSFQILVSQKNILRNI
jgi:hypothetical protein